MTVFAGPPVVVGVDGSESSLAAVRLGVTEASARHRPLHLVHAFVWPSLHAPLGPPPVGPAGAGLRHEAERIVREAEAYARKESQDVPVTTRLVDGSPAPVLLGAAHDASLLVIGDRGLGGFTGLLVGSVAVQAATYAACPVLVARGTPRGTGPVVVGVDGSETSRLAIAFALETAARRGAPLVAVHAWMRPVPGDEPGDMLPLVYDMAEVEAQERRLLAESLAGEVARWPDVPAEQRTVRRRPAAALVQESVTAQLVVVGARGRGGFAGLLLGSVSQAVLHHSYCPVAIVRAGAHPVMA